MEFPDVIKRGWHCPPAQAKYKSTAYIDDVSDELLLKFADMSYDRAKINLDSILLINFLFLLKIIFLLIPHNLYRRFFCNYFMLRSILLKEDMGKNHWGKIKIKYLPQVSKKHLTKALYILPIL